VYFPNREELSFLDALVLENEEGKFYPVLLPIVNLDDGSTSKMQRKAQG